MTRLGRYELGPSLGEGGSGVVYRATLHGPGGLRRPVALKVLASEALRREARISGLLRHRHLVDVFEVGVDEGTWFCAMELCAGGSLAEHLPLPPRAVVEVGLAVCEALQYAHAELGLVHLDIKPQNLLLTDDGTVKLADLGIAEAAGFERDGQVRGTPWYMAPEQRRGEPAGPAADLFALGVTLVELATAHRPGASTTLDVGDTAVMPRSVGAETLDVESLPIDVERQRPCLPPWLAPAVERCLAWDPEDRWPDMAALAAALRALDADGPGLAEALDLPRDPKEPSDPESSDPARFIGRERELPHVLDLLDRPGAITLKGPPGIGKSRLAVEASTAWGGGLARCAASEATSPAGLLHAVGRALGVPLVRGDAIERLGHALAARGRFVLVVDDLDPRSEAAPILERWLASAPELRLLLTSRTTVGLARERLVEVAPLDGEASVALLRARALERGVDTRGDPDLAELATALDGIPLALELAAGRLGVLTARDVLERVGKGILRSAETGRHQTLLAALEWSWELLDEPHRDALGRLAAFRGGFTLEAAEAVMEPSHRAPIDRLGDLIDHSMVRAEASRFDLLGPVRAFVEARATDEVALRRHAAWYARLGDKRAVAALSGSDGARLRAERTPELENLVVACRRSAASGWGDLAVRTLAGAWSLMSLVGPYPAAADLAVAVTRTPQLDERERFETEMIAQEALRLAARREEAMAMIDAAEAHARTPAHQARIWAARGRLIDDGTHPKAAREALERAADLARAAGLPREEAVAVGNLGLIESHQGNLDAALVYLTRALDLQREAGDLHGQAVALGNLATVHQRGSRPELAREHYEQALALHRALGARRSMALIQANLAALERQRGQFEHALTINRQCLETLGDLGDRTSQGVVLGNLGLTLCDLGRFEASEDAYHRSLEIHRSTGSSYHEGTALANLGLVCAITGRTEEAREYYRQAEEIHRRSGSRQGLCVTLGNLANSWRHEHPARARALLDEAIELALSSGDKRFSALWLAQRSLVGTGEGDLDRVDRAEAELAGIEDPAMWTKVRGVRAVVLARIGRLADAERALQAAEASLPDGDRDAAGMVEEARRAVRG